MKKYEVYLSGEKQVVEINPDAMLSELRNKLTGAKDSQFVYYNSFTEKKTILDDLSLEATKKIKQISFKNNIVIMTVVKGKKTDLFGMKTSWLNNGHMGVKVILNKTDSTAITQNQGKFDPIMIKDVQKTNPNTSGFYQNAVICEKGSVISFDISSWGAAGFGYSVGGRAKEAHICEELYNSYGDDQDKQSYSSLRRYSDSNNTIKIDSLKNLNIPEGMAGDYQKITIKTWKLISYKKGGNTYTSNNSPSTVNAQKTSIEMSFTLSSGYTPEAANGNTYVPGKDINNAAPSKGKASEQEFGSITVLKEDDKEHDLLGVVHLHFFVFKDREAANRVIKILNEPDPIAIG